MSKDKEPQGVTDTLSDAYERVSDTVVSTYSAAREKASEAVHGTSFGFDANPLLALVGGLALGAIAGALVPRSERERELLAPVGSRIAEAAKAAIEAARTTGADALGEAGISQDNLRAQSSKLFESLFQAVGAAGTAALSAAREGAAK